MIIFLCLISLILGLVLLFSNPIFFGVISLLFFTFIFFRFGKKKLLSCLLSFSIGISLFSFTSFIDFGKNINGIFLVIKATKNYYIVSNYINKFYVYDKDNDIEAGDILSLNGSTSDNNFITLESEFNFNDYLVSLGAKKTILIENCMVIVSSISRNKAYKTRLLNALSSENQDLFKLIMYGEDIDSTYSNNLKNLNVIFLLSCGGYFISLIMQLVNLLFKRILDDKKSALLTILTLFPFALLNLFKFSIIRIYVLFINKSINKYYLKTPLKNIGIVSLTGIGFLIIDPHLVFSLTFIVGFGLSFINTFINDYVLTYRKSLQFLIRKILIYIFIIPMSIINNGVFNPLSIIIQIVLIPLFDALFVTMFVSFFLGESIFLKYLFDLILIITNFFGKYSLLLLYTRYSIEAVTIIYLFEFLIFILVELRITKYIKFAGLVGFFAMLIMAFPFNNCIHGSINFINIGQGDSILIQDGFTNILIDTGGSIYKDLATSSLIPYFIKKQIYKIDAIFISHFDYDHYGALNSLIENFKVKKVISGNDFYEIRIKNLCFQNLNYGNDSLDKNETSQVLFFTYNSDNFLFMGDAPISVEKKIIEKYPNLDCDYLKVGHHGSKTSSSLEFLKLVTPREAIISVGKKNSYGLPDKEIIKELQNLNIKIRRTDVEGTISYIY